LEVSIDRGDPGLHLADRLTRRSHCHHRSDVDV
jgi:hypothetical protein